MAVERTSFLAVLEDSYSAYYNVINDDLPTDQYPIVFRADYFKRGEKYWMTKSIPIWGNETNEFFYLFSANRLDAETVKGCIDYALAEGLPRVRPHKEHQYTNIKVLFVADEFGDGALNEVKKAKHSVSYNHSLWGYSELLTAAVNCQSEAVVTNRAGSDMKKYFKKLFTAQHKS